MLEDAMMLFWAQGYTTTSIQQLLDVMGISRSSMYTEFGNKRDLFVEAMALYFSLSNVLIDAISSAENPVDAVILRNPPGYLRKLGRIDSMVRRVSGYSKEKQVTFLPTK